MLTGADRNAMFQYRTDFPVVALKRSNIAERMHFEIGNDNVRVKRLCVFASLPLCLFASLPLCVCMYACACVRLCAFAPVYV